MTAKVSLRRAALGIALTCATVATAAAVPSSARLVRAEPLGAVTTITATTSGTASLVLYDDATISASMDRNPDVTIAGKGRVVGFDLTSASGTAGNSLDEFTAVRLPAFVGAQTLVTGMSNAPRRCSDYPNATLPVKQECSGCSYTPSSQVPVQEDCPYAEPKFFTLHEGYYQLSVLTDGAPVRITLRLHGVGKSRAKVALQSTFRSMETTLAAHESIGSTTITYGGSASFPNVSQILTIVGVKYHPGATVLADSLCWRSDSGAPPPYAYSPACPGGNTQSYGYRIASPLGPAGGGGVFAGQIVPSGTPNGIGGSFVDSDGPTYAGGVAVWTDRPEPFYDMLQGP
jgi:hypothetical protein